MKYASLILSVALVACDPDSSESPVTAREDYRHFLDAGVITLTNDTFIDKFWSDKVAAEPKAAIFYRKWIQHRSQQFDKTGDVALLREIDSLLDVEGALLPGEARVNNLLLKSSNAIKMHRFKKAAMYAQDAYDLTDKRFGPLMMMFDAYMELGYYRASAEILKVNKRPDSFDYLVRLSKYQDHVGDLDSAITLMESALHLVKPAYSGKALWARAALGDMYGHAGRLKDAYTQYLTVLQSNPDFDHALRGIAWIAYANDLKIRESEEILHLLKSRSLLPDTYLLLAELAEFQENERLKEQYLDAFLEEAAQAKYGDMYNKYLIEIWSEKADKLDDALRLARKEVDQRATPLTYGLLAWCYTQKGDKDQALDILNKQVIGRTFEPDVICKVGMIYYLAGFETEATTYLKEALEASFELGPAATRKIKKTLAEIG